MNTKGLSKELREYIEARNQEDKRGKVTHSVQFPTELFNEILALARRRQCSVGATVRNIVDMHIRFLKQAEFTEMQQMIMCGVEEDHEVMLKAAEAKQASVRTGRWAR